MLSGSVRQQQEMDDGSEDVNDFLKRIRELGDKRDREDAERTRKLEEEILQGRREREARRQERARSLSPEKASPSPQSVRSFANTPVKKPLESPIISPLAASGSIRVLQPSRLYESTVSDTVEAPTAGSPLQTPVASAGTSPTRAGTLSWQRRPGSSGAAAKPHSMLAPGNRVTDSPKATPEPVVSSVSGDVPISTGVEELSRAQIAQSLSSRSPGWFRQTADRGAGSAAYRRSALGEHQLSDSGPTRRLIGLSEDQGAVPDRPASPTESLRSSTFRRGSVRGTAPSAFNLSMSLDQGRTSPERIERPISPTKGMGGFVQSAMLKRSDSVNKRWSAQAGSSLHRQNSTMSMRSGLGSLMTSTSMPKLEPSPEHSEDSVDANGWPSSSYSNNTMTESIGGLQRETSRASHHSRAKSASIISSHVSLDDSADISPPASPSKRFSPTKSSWLESALSKPESKTRVAPPLAQPAWMAEINKAKQQRNSEDPSKPKELLHTTTPELPVKPRKFSPGPAFKKEAQQDIVIANDSTVLESSAEKSNSTSTAVLEASPRTVKPKPNTPPKKDFRSTLKPRQPPADTRAQEEPEFRSMFGKLKRTQTEKFMAPDELKGNILRGKAGLVVSAGPQKADHRDELKESLLKQKETMKGKRSASINEDTNLTTAVENELEKTPEAVARQQSLRGKSKPMPPFVKRKHMDDISNGPPLGEWSVSETGTTSSVLEEQIEEPEQLSTQPTSERTITPAWKGAMKPASTTADERLQPAISPEKQKREVAAPEITTAISSKLANRFNPSLVNAIARGAPPTKSRIPSRNDSGAGGKVEAEAVIDHEAEGGSTTSKELTHMTKTRARGPKRRLPNMKSEPLETGHQEKSKLATTQHMQDNAGNMDVPEFAPSRAAEPILSNGHAAEQEVKALEKMRPPTPLKSPSLKLSSAKPQRSPKEDKQLNPTRSPPQGRPSPPSKLGPKPRLEGKEDSGRPPTTPPSVRSASALWGRPSPAGGRPMPTSSLKLPARQEVPAGLGLTFQPDIMSPPATVGSPGEGMTSLPVDARKQEVNGDSKPIVRLTDQSTEVGRLFANFFDDITSSHLTSPRIDTQQILTSRPDESKVKTLRKTIQEIGSDGKSLLNVPSHQEHVLFSDSMYLCTHVFGGLSGRVTEVYLWAGVGVPQPDLEDAQSFARKTAMKDGKLIVFRHGKETPNFFQALGGIVITRRGNRSLDTLTEYLLCGRRHQGHIAFDEVDLSLNLSGGFPYLVCAKSGKVYLWKGVGCNTEELACGRLIGMDLSVTGEIIEVEQGSEPKDFLEIFPPLGPKQLRVIPRSAEHWSKKAKHENYSIRLYRIDQQQGGASQSTKVSSFWPLVRRPSQQDKATNNNVQITVSEISPFCQTDLEPENIYVLDAFFEIYLIVGALSSSKFSAFAAALTFTTDYGILAASLEDRPFVPVSTVVMEGVPRDMKACFRGWRDDLVDTGALMAGSRGLGSAANGASLGRGRSLRVVSLGAAVEGIRGLEKG